jgi:N-acetylmuramoyl-L-alanine amidase
MRWIERSGAAEWRSPLAVFVLGLIGVVLLSAAPPEKHLSVYSTAATYSVPLVAYEGRDYVGLLELLDPLGSVNAKADGPRWRLRYNNTLADFVARQSRARVQGRDTDLGGAFRVENGRGLVPVSALGSLLPRILGGPVTLHEDSDRLFIGSVATHFTAAVAEDNPAQLVLHFTAAVNPTVATEPGKVHLTFNREPVTAPASPMLTFNSKAIPSATYSESSGHAEITVSTSIPLMVNFSSDRRTLTLAPASGAPQTAAAAPSAPSAAPTPGAIAPSSPMNPPVSIARRYFAVVDASHGGDDRGEALSNVLAEKDVTVAFARRLRQELESRGISTLVLRDSDATLGLDERASFANTTHAAVYIALHADSSGHGVRLYTSLLPYGGEDRGPFRSWNTAQSSVMTSSQAAASSVAAELRKQQIEVRILSAPLRPLNNVVEAAIAVEIAPQASDLSQLTTPGYQQLIAGAVATGIAAIRNDLGAATP